MNDAIVIRGIGLITPLGGSAASTFTNLVAGQFISDHSRCTVPLDETNSRVSQLAEIVAAEAIKSAGWTSFRLADPRTALVVGTSRGPADEWIAGQPSSRSEPNPFGLCTVADHLAQRFRLGFGPRLTLSGACASGLHAIIRAASLLSTGDADRVLVVAAESSLHPLFLESFRRLGVLPPLGERCRPFDTQRSGFLCAESAAAVVLERAAIPSPGEVTIDRSMLAADATHLTGSDPSGSTLKRVLANVMDARPIDLIHAHGTGTAANDAAEADAIDAVLASSLGTTDTSRPIILPAVYSHKGAIGHTVGAAGLVSIVLNVLMHQSGIVPPNVGVREAIPLRYGVIDVMGGKRTIRRSLACSAGFGGATAAVSLQTVR